MSNQIIVNYYHLLILYCVLRGLGGTRGSMVPNSDNRITNYINQSQCSSYLKESMAQFLWNSEVFLVPILDVDIMGIARQNIE